LSAAASARADVEPARQSRLIELRAAERHRQHQSEDDAEHQGSAVIVQDIHGFALQVIVSVDRKRDPSI
jgi:hypothetical protein